VIESRESHRKGVAVNTVIELPFKPVLYATHTCIYVNLFPADLNLIYIIFRFDELGQIADPIPNTIIILRRNLSKESAHIAIPTRCLHLSKMADGIVVILDYFNVEKR